MSIREPKESLFSWPLWGSIALVGLLLVFIAPHGLTAPNRPDEPAAPTPKGQPGGVEERLRRLEEKMERLPQSFESRRETPQDKERIVASGNVVTNEIKVADFKNVRVGSALAVEITRGDSFKVTVTASDNLHQYIQVAKDGNTLKIGMESGKNYDTRREQIKVAIAMPALESVDIGGASKMTVNGFKAKEFKAKVTGASTLKGAIAAEKVTFDATGASTLTLTGTAKEAQLAATGASTLRLADFPLASPVVNLTGASSATVQAKASLMYNVTGASSLRYSDSPKLVGKTAGASSVSRKRDN